MKSVYIESSVISYLTGRPSRDIVTSARQTITTEWWETQKDNFEVFVSELVINEISSGDSKAAQKRISVVNNIQVLEATKYANDLAKFLIGNGAVPASSVEDALHIGIAAAQGMDFLLTWNFKHINNAVTRDRIGIVITQQGYVSPILCSPEELFNDR
jgi:hypothetical protein